MTFVSEKEKRYVKKRGGKGVDKKRVSRYKPWPIKRKYGGDIDSEMTQRKRGAWLIK